MGEHKLTQEHMMEFEKYLIMQEKSTATVEKYLRDVRAFFVYVGTSKVTKEQVIDYKKQLMDRGYAVRSVNSMLASINSMLEFLGWQECKVKSLKLQQQVYRSEEKELTKKEYLRLLQAAKHNPKLRLIMETIGGTGIRISELRHFTVEAVKKGEVVINCKSKIRTILLPTKLRMKLLDYVKKRRILTGIIFRTKNGNPMNRSNIWKQMKMLCEKADIEESKVFPHNLRRLFARTFYEMDKDIAKLADLLGHSSINTTRIYIMTTGIEHRRQLERLGLVI